MINTELSTIIKAVNNMRSKGEARLAGKPAHRQKTIIITRHVNETCNNSSKALTVPCILSYSIMSTLLYRAVKYRTNHLPFLLHSPSNVTHTEAIVNTE